ncbi:MAG: DUF58 domain-containing protein [Chlamydia sp.]
MSIHRYSPSELLVSYLPDEKALNALSGLYQSSIRGRGIEFEKMRLYVPGDDPKNVSWAKLAQTGQLYSKSFCEERDLVVYIVVDPSLSMSWFRTVKSECVLAIVRMLLFSAMANRDRIGLVSASQASSQCVFIPANRGSRSIEYAEILSQKVSINLEINRIMQLEKNPQVTGISLHELLLPLIYTARMHKGIIFVLSDFLNFDQPSKKAFEKLSISTDLIPVRILDIWDQNPCGLQENWVGAIHEKISYGPLIDQFDEAAAASLKKIIDNQIFDATELFQKKGLDCIEVWESDLNFFGTNSPYFALKKFFDMRRYRR